MMFLEEVNRHVKGHRHGENPWLEGVSIDTRTLKEKELYVAIKGERLDGHDFIDQAEQKGASALLISQTSDPIRLPYVKVDDTTAALGDLGAGWRRKFDLPVVAITGSNGKTTVKEILASICRQHSQGLATKGNLNNHVGVPLTLLRLTEDHRWLIIEMGMNHLGELRYLSSLAHPSTVIITNAAAAHLEGVGDISQVAQAKAEVFAGQADSGAAILNRDDDFFEYWKTRTPAERIVSFGFHDEADVRISRQSTARNSLWISSIHYGDRHFAFGLDGAHNAMNAAAAVAAAGELEVPIEAVNRGLASVRPVPGRLQRITINSWVTLLDDSYNANPASLEAALRVLAESSRKKILVLGDMAELGENGAAWHQQVGALAKECGVTHLAALGELTRHTVQAFGHGALHYQSAGSLLEAMVKMVVDQPVEILIKGSRSMHMENLVEAFKQRLSAAGQTHAICEEEH